MPKAVWEVLFNQAIQLETQNLLELQAAIEAYVKALGTDTKQGQRDSLTPDGFIEWKMIPRPTGIYGPYPYLRYQHQGKQRSLYLRAMAKATAYLRVTEGLSLEHDGETSE
jgi:hypothetical protein